MTNNKIWFIFLFLFFPSILYCQYKIEEMKLDSLINDSAYYSGVSLFYYDYFFRRIDSSAVVDFTGATYIIRYIVDTRSNKGFYRVFYSNFLVFEYETIDGNINGLGVFNNFLLKRKIYEATFVNNELNGILIIYNEKGSISYIGLYENNKFKKYYYFNGPLTKKDLKIINRRFSDPLSWNLRR